MKFVSKIPVLTLLFVGVLLLSPQCTRAQFTAGNIVVVRVGDGSATLTSAATPVFLDEYKTTGTYVQTITVNASTPGSRSTNSGTATSEGFVHRSVDGRYVAFGGYDAASGTASITSSNSSSINRVIARVDALGSIDYSTKINDSAAPGNIRSTTTSDGSAFWAGTSGGGVKYVAFGNTGASVQLSTAPANARVVNIFNDHSMSPTLQALVEITMVFLRWEQVCPQLRAKQQLLLMVSPLPVVRARTITQLAQMEIRSTLRMIERLPVAAACKSGRMVPERGLWLIR